MLISKGDFLERGMLDTNKGILVKIHLIFFKKIACYANAFFLKNADVVRRKVFALMFFMLHQL